MKLKILYLLLLVTNILLAQTTDIKLAKRIDSLLLAKTQKPFNGVVLISQNGKVIYKKMKGQSDIEKRVPLKLNDQFVIGSISKQITAVLVLQQVDKGLIKLDAPMRRYFKGVKDKWADSVTIHHLLTHTHGITETGKPLAFRQGTQYKYSQLGYDLLSKIVEKVSGKSFSTLSEELFKSINMTSSFHPDNKSYNVVAGYTEDKTGKLYYEEKSFENFAAAGSFVSTANDLVLWNESLHNGKLLKDSTYQLMITKDKVAVREHPVFGLTNYGYGITIDNSNNLIQLGQTGFAPGFVSMDFYFPESKTSLVILSNAPRGNDLKQAFFYHTEMLKFVKTSELVRH
jgi:D-alanyl-D-alanine carboxypeptidase